MFLELKIERWLERTEMVKSIASGHTMSWGGRLGGRLSQKSRGGLKGANG